jgi:hypothetical protein
MPIFEVEASGRRYEVEAQDERAALKALALASNPPAAVRSPAISPDNPFADLVAPTPRGIPNDQGTLPPGFILDEPTGGGQPWSLTGPHKRLPTMSFEEAWGAKPPSATAPAGYPLSREAPNFRALFAIGMGGTAKVRIQGVAR